ncbi:MAG: hypothetical protein ACLPHP_18470 [Candidatus Sulfotelmatobacter sp.]
MKVKAESWNESASRSPVVIFCIVLCVAVFSASNARAQSCQTSSELDDVTLAGISAAGQRYFGLAAKADVASLRQSSIASLASDFSGIEATVKDHQQDLAGAQATVKSVFLLETEGSAPVPHAEFYCGVFGKNGQTSGSAVFEIDNLPPGKYAVALLDATSPTARTMFSVILQQAGTDWKLGGLYLKPALVAGHDSDWFIARARDYKTKGQAHNAWFYYLEATSLISPLPFMATAATDKLSDESQNVRPTDLPSDGKTVDLAAAPALYKLTAIFPQAVADDLDLIVKYQAADVSNTNQAYQNNLAIIKALVAKYPELKDAFAGVVARAVDPTGHDYGTLLAMKDIK